MQFDKSHTKTSHYEKNNNSIESQKYKVRCFKLPQDCAQWQPSELNTLVGQTVLLFLIIFYSLCGTKCKFPDFFQHSFFSLTFTKIPWLFPDFCQVWNFPDFSLTAGHPAWAFKWFISAILSICYKIVFIELFAHVLTYHHVINTSVIW